MFIVAYKVEIPILVLDTAIRIYKTEGKMRVDFTVLSNK